ncbi:MAG: hypothetical protein KGL39_09775 [Patescibacteria group bacterium]|nr:hypothetical protein [Patescibacteria group bacterium]
MRAVPLIGLQRGIDRLRIKGGASRQALYNLTNAYINQEGVIVPRAGTTRVATLDSTSVGLMASEGIFNIFSTGIITGLPTGFQTNLLLHPTIVGEPLKKIWFAQPFMGFPYVVAEFQNGDVFHYWLQSGGAWAPHTVYMANSIVVPTAPNGLAYQAVRDLPPNPLWAPNTQVAVGYKVEPTEYTGYYYKAVQVTPNAFTGTVEPNWPSSIGAEVQEFGNFSVSLDAGSAAASSSGVPTLSQTITDRYGDSETIANSGSTAASGNGTSASASTNVTVWQAGTLYAPGAVVKPSTNQGAYLDAIPNGDFEQGNVDWNLGAGWSIVDNEPYQGNYCAYFVHTGSGFFDCTMQTGAAVTPGQSVTMTGYARGDSDGQICLILNWYDSTGVLISTTKGALGNGGGGGSNPTNYAPVSVTGVAPANAASCKGGFEYQTGSSSARSGWVDLLSWSLEVPAAISQLYYEAIQAAPAVSGATEPAWPQAVGGTVVDGGVTWEAIGSSIITWEAFPIMESGTTEPAWPTVVGETVSDADTAAGAIGTVGGLVGGSGYTNGTYNNVVLTGGNGAGATAGISVQGGIVTAISITIPGQGYHAGDVLSCPASSIGGTGTGWSITVETVAADTTATGMSWICINRQITDPKCPNTTGVALGASHVFAVDKDIVAFSAAVDPTDWSTANDAGYIPTGLNNYGNNPMVMLGLYRSNLTAFNSNGYQMWQIDPDPANMAILDAEPAGCDFVRSGQSVANDFLFMSQVGIRNLEVIGLTANLQIGNTGQPVDALVVPEIQAGTYDPLSLYYPGKGQGWWIFGPQAFVMTMNGSATKTWSRYYFPDSITDWTINDGVLYLRTAGNLVWKFDESELNDDSYTTQPIAATWTAVSSPIADTYSIYGVAYGNGMWVALAEDGTATHFFTLTSTDGLTWSENQVNVNWYGDQIFFANGAFFAKSKSPTALYRSTDGVTWTQVLATTANSANFTLPVVYANGEYVLAGVHSYFTSPDGITWTEQTTMPSPSLGGFASNFQYGTHQVRGAGWMVGVYTTDTGGNPGAPVLAWTASATAPAWAEDTTNCGYGRFYITSAGGAMFGDGSYPQLAIPLKDDWVQGAALPLSNYSNPEIDQNGTLWLIGSDINLTACHSYESTDGGQTWTNPLQISFTDYTSQIAPDGKGDYVATGVSGLEISILGPGGTGTPTFTAFTSIIQWPYISAGSFGTNKMLVGLDVVGNGQVTIQMAWNENDATSFSDNAGFSTSPSVTAAYTISIADTVPGTPIPLPINAPSYSPILTFASGQAWSLDAVNLYVNDQRGAGVTG